MKMNCVCVRVCVTEVYLSHESVPFVLHPASWGGVSCKTGFKV